MVSSSEELAGEGFRAFLVEANEHKASQYFKQALELDPDNDEARKALEDLAKK